MQSRIIHVAIDCKETPRPLKYLRIGEFFVSIVHATVLTALIKNAPAAELFHNLYIKIRRRNIDVYSRRF